MGMGKMLKLINVTEEAPEEEQNKKRWLHLFLFI
jgi:hypothetical protein